jgi:hypothetical protein
MRALLPGLTLVSLLACGGDDDCNREGCDALSRHVANEQDTTRVAGYVAYATDVVKNGCQECGFVDESSVRAWAIDEPLEDSVDVISIMDIAPDATTTTNEGAYSIELPAEGLYLVCVANGCFNVNVAVKQTTTLNVRLVYGIPQGYVGKSGADELREVDSLPTFQ